MSLHSKIKSFRNITTNTLPKTSRSKRIIIESDPESPIDEISNYTHTVTSQPDFLFLDEKPQTLFKNDFDSDSTESQPIITSISKSKDIDDYITGFDKRTKPQKREKQEHIELVQDVVSASNDIIGIASSEDGLGLFTESDSSVVQKDTHCEGDVYDTGSQELSPLLGFVDLRTEADAKNYVEHSKEYKGRKWYGKNRGKFMKKAKSEIKDESSTNRVSLSYSNNSTNDEIKKSYRSLALKWHPDKNKDNVEESNKKFAEIKEAYETLMDPHERSWYDSHREQILRGDDFAQEGQFPSGDYVGTSVSTILKYFSISVFSKFDDSKGGFYSVYRELFDKLRDEEISAISNNNLYVESEELSILYNLSFGDSTADFDPLFVGETMNNEKGKKKRVGTELNTLKGFYNYWMSFDTYKSFSWCEKYRLPDAPNRQIKRLMEKENKALRDSAKREYVDSIQNLASWLKKRDPRYLSHCNLVKKRQEEAAKQREDEITKKKKDMVANAQNFMRQEWQQVDYTNLLDEHIPEYEGLYNKTNTNLNGNDNVATSNQQKNEEHDQTLPELECLKITTIAKNTGRESVDDSDESFKTPEMSPVQLSPLKTDDFVSQLSEKDKYDSFDEDMISNLNLDDVGSDMNIISDGKNIPREKKGKSKKNKVLRFSLNSDEEVEVNKPQENLEYVQDSKDVVEDLVEIKSLDTGSNVQRNKKDKKKKKSDVLKCNVCNKEFGSRNQLFSHIKDTGHALASDVPKHIVQQIIDSRTEKSKKGTKKK
ncbi:hypothetical protein BB558_005348 [Smittium angustum]|uniref:J domain-containing protein n=1 Tax=Smittium angustum TaxID=133377 RepID=A0A2U1J0P0_SMIAN|nr:hypothetical protein BB558_005348 [Smittium angustum]